jgi:hypothetical protein
MPKGQSPNSRRNLIAGRNKKPGSKKTPMQLSEKSRRLAAIAGDGNMTEGVERSLKLYEEISQDRLFQQSPIFVKVKTLLEAIAYSNSEFSEQSEALLYELEDLLIEESHKEAVLDGAIEVKGGAYIV